MQTSNRLETSHEKAPRGSQPWTAFGPFSPSHRNFAGTTYNVQPPSVTFASSLQPLVVDVLVFLSRIGVDMLLDPRSDPMRKLTLSIGKEDVDTHESSFLKSGGRFSMKAS